MQTGLEPASHRIESPIARPFRVLHYKKIYFVQVREAVFQPPGLEEAVGIEPTLVVQTKLPVCKLLR